MNERLTYYKLLPLIAVLALALSACGEQESPEEIRAKIETGMPQPALVNGISLPLWTNKSSLSVGMTVGDGGFACRAVQEYPQVQQQGQLVQKGFVNVDGLPQSVSSVVLDSNSCKDENTHIQSRHEVTINLGEKEGPYTVQIEFANCVITDKIAGETEEICGPVLTATEQVVNLDMTPPTQDFVGFEVIGEDKLAINVVARDNRFLGQATIAGVPAEIDSSGVATVTINPNLKNLAGAQSEVCDAAENCSNRLISDLADDTQPPDFSLSSIEVSNPEIVLKIPVVDKDAPPGLDQLTTVDVEGAAAEVTKENDKARIVIPPKTDLSKVSVEVCDLFHCLKKSLEVLTGDTQPPVVFLVGPVTFSENVGSFEVVIGDDSGSFGLLWLSNIGFAGGIFPVVPFKDPNDGTIKGKAHISFTGQPLGTFSLTFVAKDAFGHKSKDQVVKWDYNPCPTEPTNVKISEDGKTVTFTWRTNNNLIQTSLKGEGNQDRWPDFFNKFPFLTEVEQLTGLELKDGEVQISFKAPTEHGDLLMSFHIYTVGGDLCSFNYVVTQMPEMTDQEKMVVYRKLIVSLLTSGALLTTGAIRRISKLRRLREGERRNLFKNSLVESIRPGENIGFDRRLIDKLSKNEQQGWLNAVEDTLTLIEIKKQLQAGELLAAYKNFKNLYQKSPKDFLAQERDGLFRFFIGLLNDQVRQIIVSEEKGPSFSILKNKEEITQMEKLIACIDDLYRLGNNHFIWREIDHRAKQVKSGSARIRTKWELTRVNIERLIIAYHYAKGDLPKEWARRQAQFNMADKRAREEVERQLNL